MGIYLGSKQVIKQSTLSLKSIRIEGLDSIDNKSINIDYYIDDSRDVKTVTIRGKEWNDFYMNKWLDGSHLFNETFLSSLLPQDVDVQTAESQFING